MFKNLGLGVVMCLPKIYRSTLFALLSVSFAATNTVAQETALRDDGRQVRLKKDGTWEYVSKDVLATSESGLRVKLRSDGTWQPLTVDKPSVTAGTISIDTAKNHFFSIEQWLIEKVNIERPGSKTDIFGYQMVVKLQSHQHIDPKQLAVANVRVQDSRGRNYPVLAFTEIAPGHVQLIIKGAPKRFGRPKHFDVVIDKAVAASLADINLRFDFRDAQTVTPVTFTE